MLCFCLLSIFTGGNAVKFHLIEKMAAKDLLVKDSSVANSQAIAAQAMEDMVLNLARQQAKVQMTQKAPNETTVDSANITDWVLQIEAVMDEMMRALLDELAAHNAQCDSAYRNVTDCKTVNYTNDTIFPQPGFDGDFTKLRTAYYSCMSSFDDHNSEFARCRAMRNSLWEQEQAALNALNDLNIYKSPEECKIHYTELDDVENYLKNMYDHFTIQAANFWNAYWRLGNLSANASFHLECAAQEYITNQTEHCSQQQLNLEQAACDYYSFTETCCQELSTCVDQRWSYFQTYLNSTLLDLESMKTQYRALKRIECLLDAFAQTDIDAAIDTCIAKSYVLEADQKFTSQCANYTGDSLKPTIVIPDACTVGITEIPRPGTEAFNITVFYGKGYTAGICLATCCGSPYTWVKRTETGWDGNADFVYRAYPSNPDASEPQYLDDAKQLCELSTTTQCGFIFDEWCDGLQNDQDNGTNPQAFHHYRLLKPGATTQPSTNIPSCIYEMHYGPAPTTTTTTKALQCSFDLGFARSEESEEQHNWSTSIFKSFTTQEVFDYDAFFRFDGCSTETVEAGKCIGGGTSSGVRIVKEMRSETAVAEGDCCNTTTNRVQTQARRSCNGYSDEYLVHENKTAQSSQILAQNGQVVSFSSLKQARETCMRMGFYCWGLVDSHCNQTTLLIIESTNDSTRLTGGDLLDDASDCVREKLAVGDIHLATADAVGM
eukprot:TRINITY_DN8568_c0_g1_i6.p1 TRINITY_DN8568_c0_g1~~TRINITY_DN8568_c0_g1_i6.p1  ORF type:complete len:719 (-),score=105.87 TRINITY_DN8568_c0_g1_i6:38-2194(-)